MSHRLTTSPRQLRIAIVEQLGIALDRLRGLSKNLIPMYLSGGAMKVQLTDKRTTLCIIVN